MLGDRKLNLMIYLLSSLYKNSDLNSGLLATFFVNLLLLVIGKAAVIESVKLIFVERRKTPHGVHRPPVP